MLDMHSPRVRVHGSTGRSYFVDSQVGRDDATGVTEHAPWRTLKRLELVRLMPGDRVLLRRGQAWKEPLRLAGSGTPAAPITIGAYGQGPRPVIDAGGRASAIALIDQDGWVVRDLALTGAGHPALVIDSTRARRSFFRVYDIEAYGASEGIRVGIHRNLSTGHPGYLDDVVVDGCVAHDVTYTGIVAGGTYGGSAPRNTNLTFRNCLVYKCGWDGIKMFCTSGGLIADSTAHDCGYGRDGRFGIWTWWSDHVVIERCEAYGIRTPGPKDGGGFDLDIGTSDCVIQYCYAHDNDGPGFAVVGSRHAPNHPPTRHVIRYNIAQGNGRHRTVDHGELMLYGGMDRILVHNNTLRTLRRGAGSCGISMTGHSRYQTDWPRATAIMNTIIYSDAGARAMNVDPEATEPERANLLDYNIYHSTNGDLGIEWGKRYYTRLTEYRLAAGLETHGLQTDPTFEAPIGVPTGRDSLTGLRLTRRSPAIDRGVTLPGHPSTDFWGNAVPGGSAPDIGAHEWQGMA
jgi:Right handed beta helix region